VLLWGVVVPSFVLLVAVVPVSKEKFVVVFLVRLWVVTSVDIATANSNKLRKCTQEGSGVSCGGNPRRKVERMIKERR
jgi:hypothetical protein